MPAASAYRRAPLVNPAYVPLSDAALHPEGTMKARIQQVLNMVNTRHMSTLDSVLATKLGGYAQLAPHARRGGRRGAFARRSVPLCGDRMERLHAGGHEPG